MKTVFGIAMLVRCLTSLPPTHAQTTLKHALENSLLIGMAVNRTQWVSVVWDIAKES